jgi:hypothetical protein
VSEKAFPEVGQKSKRCGLIESLLNNKLWEGGIIVNLSEILAGDPSAISAGGWEMQEMQPDSLSAETCLPQLQLSRV